MRKVWGALALMAALACASPTGREPEQPGHSGGGHVSIVTGVNSDLTEWGPLYARYTNWWNDRVYDWPVDPNSAALVAAVAATNELNGRLHPDFNNVDTNKRYGIPVVVVDNATPPVDCYVADLDPDNPNASMESDPGPFRIPDAAKTDKSYIENSGRIDGDRHILLLNKDTRTIEELSYVNWTGVRWTCGYAARFDLNTDARRPEGNTSSDAAGLCVAAGLLRYDEVNGAGEILHALRCCFKHNNGYVWPASHDNHADYAGAPPLGARVRLKSTFDTVNKVGGGTYSAHMQKILRCMRDYGLIVADQGGGFFIQGTMDPNWEWLGPEFHTLHIADFEFIQLGYKPENIIKSPTGTHRKFDPSLE